MAQKSSKMGNEKLARQHRGDRVEPEAKFMLKFLLTITIK